MNKWILFLGCCWSRPGCNSK